MSPKRRASVRATVGCALLMFAAVTCTDSTSPRGGRASIALVPAFSQKALIAWSNAVSAGLVVDNIHLTLDHAGGANAKDTTVAYAGEDSLIIELDVNLSGPSENLKAQIDLRDGALVLFSGTADVFAIAGPIPQPPPPPIKVEYSGPGATVTSISIAPTDSAIATSTDSIVYRPIAKDQNNQPVTDYALLWSVKDPTIGTVSTTGVFKPGAIRGQTYVIATTFTGVKDSGKVVVTPPPTKVVLISGGGQTGTVGKPLAQPLVVEVQASDNLPVPGRVVSFGVTAGGGSMTPSSAITDANGRASATLTLGTIVATNSAQASSAGLTPASANVSAVPDKAKKLVVNQQPSATIIAGTALATQPKIQVQDQFGNNVSAAGIAIGVALTSPTGRTVSGQNSATTDASGLAAFTTLGITGAVGSTTLTFGQDTLTSAISNAIAVQVGAPTTIAIAGSNTFTATAGVAPASPPAILVTDVGGNGIPDIGVHLVVTSGVVTVRDTTIATDSTGRVALDRIPPTANAGVYTLTASSGSLTGNPQVVTLTVVAAAAHHLKVGPVTSGTGGTVISPAISVEIVDQFNNRVTTGAASTASVSLAIKAATGAAGAVLGPNSGALTQNAVAGVSTFNVSIDKAAIGYVLAASSPATANGGESAAFNIAVGAPAFLTMVSGEGLGAKKGFEVFPAPKVRLTDAGLNNIAGATVTFSITSGGGETNDGTTTFPAPTDVNGLATTDWHLGLSGAQTLTASNGGLSFVFHGYLAEKLVVVQQPPTTTPTGAVLSLAPKVQLQDLSGHQSKASGVSVSVSVCCRDDAVVEVPDILLTGTQTAATDVNGEALFSNLILNAVPGVTGQLVFAATNVDSAKSVLVTMAAGAPAFISYDDGNYRFTDLLGVNVVGVHVYDALENAAANTGVQFFVDAGPCTVAAGAVTTDANGFAQVNATVPTPFTSCLIRAQTVGAGTQPKSYQRLYITGEVVTPFKIWTGAVSADWSDAGNWLDDCVPTSETDVFIPFVSGAADDPAPRNPTLYAEGIVFSGGLYTEANAHVFLNNHEMYVNTGLAAYGSIEGPGTLAIGEIIEPSGFSLLGTVHALLEIGSEGCASNNVYFAFGHVVADSVVVNCPLFVADSGFAIAGDLRVSPFSLETSYGGGIEQFGGLITVGGNANLSGLMALDGGMLDVKGHVHIESNCETSEFVAVSGHILRMSGASSDTLFLDVDAPSCGAEFGNIEIATTGPKGVAMPPHDATTVYLDSLRIKSGATFTLYAGTSAWVNPGGALDVEAGGTLALEPGARPRQVDLCSLSLTNPGPLHCDYSILEATPPSGAAAAPTATRMQAKMDELKAKGATIRATAKPFARKK